MSFIIITLFQLIQVKAIMSEKLTDTKTTLIAVGDNFKSSCSNAESAKAGQFLYLQPPHKNTNTDHECKLSLIAPNGQFILYQCPDYRALDLWQKQAMELQWDCDPAPDKIE